MPVSANDALSGKNTPQSPPSCRERENRRAVSRVGRPPDKRATRAGSRGPQKPPNPKTVRRLPPARGGAKSWPHSAATARHGGETGFSGSNPATPRSVPRLPVVGSARGTVTGLTLISHFFAIQGEPISAFGR